MVYMYTIYIHYAAATAKSLQSCPTLCDPIDDSPPGSPSLGFSRQEHWSGLPFPSPMHESEKWKWSCSVVSDFSDPMDCSLPGFSIRGIFQAKVLEWGAIAFKPNRIKLHTPQLLPQVLPIKNVSPQIIGEFGFILATSHPFSLLDPAINLSLLQTSDISVCLASLCI